SWPVSGLGSSAEAAARLRVLLPRAEVNGSQPRSRLTFGSIPTTMMVPGRSPNAQSCDLVALRPFTPMRRLNEDVLLVQSIDPFGSIFVTGEHERVDNSIIVQDADFEISVRWRN